MLGSRGAPGIRWNYWSMFTLEYSMPDVAHLFDSIRLLTRHVLRLFGRFFGASTRFLPMDTRQSAFLAMDELCVFLANSAWRS